MIAFVGLSLFFGSLFYILRARNVAPAAPVVTQDAYVNEPPAILPDEPEFIASGGDLIPGSVDTEMATVFPTFQTGAVASNPLDALFVKYGTLYNIEPRLLKAIAIVESSLNPFAVRNNPPRDVSVGLMQILCLPDGKGGCTNNFNVDGWKGITFDALKDPDKNLSIGVQILAWNIRTFGYMRGIAVYNSWSARNDPPNGPFMNQGYVDKVLKHYNKL